MMPLLALAALTVAVAAPTPADESFPFDPAAPASGRWVGQLTIDDQPRHAVLDIERFEGAWRARATVLAAMVLDQAATELHVDARDVRFTVVVRGTEHDITATVSEDAQRLTGQGTKNTTIELERIAFVSDLPEPMAFTGALSVPGVKLDMTITMARSAQGRWLAELDVPLQSVSGAPLFDVALENGAFEAMLPGPAPARFELTMAEDRQSMSGSFRQGMAQMPLEMVRAEIGSSGLERPQHPKEPYPYTIAEIRAPHPDGHMLVGTLSVPDADAFGPPPYPAAVLISGSGQQDRDETIVGHKPFLVLADHLTRHGIAVMRYDDRGVGGSAVDDINTVLNATSADFASDTAAVVEALKQREEIDAGRIGLIGHSEGGIIAPMLAAERDDIAFMVLLAATAVPGRDVLLLQTRLIHEAMGADERRLADMNAAQNEAMDLIIEGGAPGDIKAAIRRVIEIQSDGASLSPADMTAAVETYYQQSMLPWMKFFMTYDPREALAGVRCPVLALNGTLDLQVGPDQNLPVIDDVLRRGAGTPDVTIKRYDGLNHLFQPAVTGAPAEYATIETTIDERVLEDIASWITERMRNNHEQRTARPSAVPGT